MGACALRYSNLQASGLPDWYEARSLEPELTGGHGKILCVQQGGAKDCGASKRAFTDWQAGSREPEGLFCEILEFRMFWMSLSMKQGIQGL